MKSPHHARGKYPARHFQRKRKQGGRETGHRVRLNAGEGRLKRLPSRDSTRAGQVHGEASHGGPSDHRRSQGCEKRVSLGRPRWAWGLRDCGWNRQKWEAPLSLGFPVNLLMSVPLAADRNQPISSGQQQGSAIDQQAGSTLSFLPTHSPEASGQGCACCLGRSCWASSSHRLLFCPPAKNTEDNLSA